VSPEIRALIFRMAAENPTWGAPRIHGELLKLGFNLSEPTVSRWLRHVPRTPDRVQRWLTFLRNHREAIAAMDFFTVPTITFGVLYCFFAIGHDRRKILHFNVTRNPTAFGSCSRCEKRGRTRRPKGSCCSTATRSSATT
jgi:putative transposase